MEHTRRSSEEIDLLYFFQPVINGFKKLWDGLKRLSYRVWENIGLFSIIVAVITTAGYCLRYIIPPGYQSKAIFISHVLPAEYCERLLKNLDQLKSEKNLPVLADQLKISKDAAKSIQCIDLKPIADTFVMKKTDDDSTLAVFEIRLILSEITYVDSIQNGLVNYLENNPFSLKRKEALRHRLNSLKSVLEVKLQGLDSLKKIVNSNIFPQSVTKGIISAEPINPASIVQAEVSYLKSN